MVGDGVDKIHFRGNLQDVVASLWSGLREEESGSRMPSIFLASCVRGGGEDREQSRRVDDHFCSDLKRPAGHSSFRTCSIRQRPGSDGEGRGGEVGRWVVKGLTGMLQCVSLTFWDGEIARPRH